MLQANAPPSEDVTSGSPEMQKALSPPTSQWREQAITMESTVYIGKGSFPSIYPEVFPSSKPQTSHLCVTMRL